jgi:hypothetical protein
MIPQRHPSTEHILRYFTYSHLPPYLQRVSRHFAVTADIMVGLLPDSPELSVCLRKLLEAKDCAVRAALDVAAADPAASADDGDTEYDAAEYDADAEQE